MTLPDGTPLLWTLDEAAERLRVSRRTVNNLISRGRLRVVHVCGRSPRVTERELVAYVASLEREARRR